MWYLRELSTQDRGQDTENQLIALREYAARQQWEIIHVYEDHVSGKTGDREAFRGLFEDAARRSFHVVLVWALDRLTREGVFETFEYIRKLTAHGVKFESYTETHFRTTAPAGELSLAIAAWTAKQERIRIAERTRAGIERARRQGKHIGRPKGTFRRDLARELRREGWSWGRIATQLGVPVSTIRDACLAESVLVEGGNQPCQRRGLRCALTLCEIRSVFAILRSGSILGRLHATGSQVAQKQTPAYLVFGVR
jgi:DNA invertase Pin-like site-specific DNA recombinase